MENFDWSQFTQKIAIKSTLPAVYSAWASATEIEKWFLKKAIYFDQQKNRIEASEFIQNNCTYEWSWYAQDSIEKGKIVLANELNMIQFTFAGECFVEVSLKEKGEYVLVELTQSGIPTDANSKQNIRLGCFSGWAFYLVNLKSVLEGGLDLRNKNAEFVTMLNN